LTRSRWIGCCPASRRPENRSRSRSWWSSSLMETITYPTGKIYIGKDSVGSARYMGSPNMDLVNADFASLADELRRDYTIRNEILWESDTASEAELFAKEIEMIRKYRSNDPTVGYNRWPKFKVST